jgi:hypothetical protein
VTDIFNILSIVDAALFYEIENCARSPRVGEVREKSTRSPRNNLVQVYAITLAPFGTRRHEHPDPFARLHKILSHDYTSVTI